MKATVSAKALLLLLLCVAGGCAAGFFNGLLGTGAGVVFLLLYRVMRGELTKDAFAFSMACVIPLSAFSLFTYQRPADFSLPLLFGSLLASAGGGLCGALLQRKLKINVLKKLFAALVIYSGLTMLLR